MMPMDRTTPSTTFCITSPHPRTPAGYPGESPKKEKTMKTQYQQITEKIEILEGAAMRCMNRDKKPMASVWLSHANSLRNFRDEMVISDAFKVWVKE